MIAFFIGVFFFIGVYVGLFLTVCFYIVAVSKDRFNKDRFDE